MIISSDIKTFYKLSHILVKYVITHCKFSYSERQFYNLISLYIMTSQFYKHATSLQQKLKYECDCFIKVHKSVRKYRHCFLSDHYLYIMSENKIRFKLQISKIIVLIISNNSDEFVIISEDQGILGNNLTLRQMIRKQMLGENTKGAVKFVKQTLLDSYAEGKKGEIEDTTQIIDLVKLKKQHEEFNQIVIKKKFNDMYQLDQIIYKDEYYSMVIVTEKKVQMQRKKKKNSNKDKPKKYTVKIYPKKNIGQNKQLLKQILNERFFLEQIMCPYTPQLYKCCYSRSYIYCMTEYYKGDSLQTYLQNETMYKNDMKMLIAQIVIALGQLHQCNVIYGSVSLKGIFVSDNGFVMLNYFTNSSVNKNGGKGDENQKQNGFGKDWWDLGLLVYEIKQGKPWKEGEYIPEWKEKQLTPLIQSLLNKQQTNRIGFRSDYYEILNHPFFKGLVKKEIATQTSQPLRKFFKMKHDMFKQKVGLPEDIEDWSIHDSYLANYEYSRELQD